MSFNTKSSLLYHQETVEGDSYFSPCNKSSNYYKRSNLLIGQQSSSFRQKCKGLRSRSSSYTSLDDNKKDDSLLNSQDIPLPSPASTTPITSNNKSIFSRKKNLGMTRTNRGPASYNKQQEQPSSLYDEENNEDIYDDDSDENTFFAKQGNYARQNLSRSSSSSSWKSCVLRAVGVKRSIR